MKEKEKIDYNYLKTEKVTNLNKNINSSFIKENEEEILLNNNSNLNIKKINHFFKNNSNKFFSKISINCQSKSSLFNNSSIIKKRFSTPKRIIPDRLIIKIGKNDYEPKRKSIFDISTPLRKKKRISNLELYEKEKENQRIRKLFMNIFNDSNEYLKKIEKNQFLFKNNIIKNKKDEYKKSIFYLNTTNYSNVNKKIKIDFRPLKKIKIPIKLKTYDNFNNSKSTNNSSRNNSLSKQEISFNKNRNLKLQNSIPNLRYKMIINNYNIKNIKKYVNKNF
jgi:hypothetical protein